VKKAHLDGPVVSAGVAPDGVIGDEVWVEGANEGVEGDVDRVGAENGVVSDVGGLRIEEGKREEQGEESAQLRGNGQDEGNERTTHSLASVAEAKSNVVTRTAHRLTDLVDPERSVIGHPLGIGESDGTCHVCKEKSVVWMARSRKVRGSKHTEKGEERLVSEVEVLNVELVVGLGEAVESGDDAGKDSTTSNCRKGQESAKDGGRGKRKKRTVAESAWSRVGEELVLVVAIGRDASQLEWLEETAQRDERKAGQEGRT
jgi:hypothetical protein